MRTVSVVLMHPGADRVLRLLHAGERALHLEEVGPEGAVNRSTFPF